jgi:competence ComEA-like helix-hairpin-helix protein
MAKISFVRHVQEFFGVTKNEVVAVMVLVGGLVVGVVVRYNPFGTIHPAEYDPVLAQRIYSVLDSIAEVENRLYTGVDEQGNAPLIPGDTAKAIARYSTKKKELPTKKVNIAIALKAEMMRLPGIGEAMADRIVEFRKTTSFTSTEDLMKVKGIGKKKFEKIEPYIICEKKK